MFKKMIISIMLSMMLIFIIWCTIGYQEYGAELINKHIDLRYMFIRFRSEFFSYNILDDLHNIKNLTATFSANSMGGMLLRNATVMTNAQAVLNSSNIVTFIIQALTILISPITSILYGITLLIYILGSGLLIILAIVDLLLICLEFVFMPVFI